MKIMAREKSTRRLSPSVRVRFVENAEQQVPQRVAGFFDFIEQDEADLDLFGVILIQHFLAQQRVRFAMPEISGRRADQFGDLVAVLKLGAVDLENRAGVADERFGGGFDQPGLARPGGSEETENFRWAGRGWSCRRGTSDRC